MNQNNWVKEIQDRSQRMPFLSGRSNKSGKISWEDLVFTPAQLKKKAVDYFKEEISSKTVVGGNSKQPVILKVPIIFGGMSFGALSKEAKIALAKASKIAGTIANTGEGGMLPEEREFAQNLTVQYSTGRFGISDEILKQANVLEIKIGQGAKAGQGGMLAKDKVTEEIAQVRNVPMGEDVHSPAYHHDINNIEDLKRKVDWLRELSGGKPIIIKLGAGNVAEDVKLAVQAGPDVIAVDGLEGGTGASPEVMLDDVGLPTIPALIIARRTLDELNAPQELWIAGGLSKGADFAKALALGADAVFVAFPLLVAMGCVYCRQCYKGKCPRGIATQDPDLRKNLNMDEAVQQVANFITNCSEEIKMVAGAVGHNNIHNLSRDDLRSLSLETAKITGAKFVSE